jgi:predicted RNA-binding protein Jag|tara:strand:+ start:21 stop:362 length:342 start_codon:yes stop_codon:yes gene_type:complete
MSMIESLFEDTSDSLDLENIKNKITTAYQKMLEQAFKKSNPVGSPEQLTEFLEQNELKFGVSEDFEKDSKQVEEVLDKLLKKDDIKPLVETEKEKLSKVVQKHQKEKLGGLFA